MDIIQWVLNNGNRVQTTFSTSFGDLTIDMRLYNSTARCKQVLDKRDLAQMEGKITEILDWMLYELLKYDICI